MGAPGTNGERVRAAGTSLPPDDELHSGAFRGRLNEPVAVSYAQNAEDVRLFRVLGKKKRGFYIDVGAGHPERDSVTKLFYDAGWSGLNIEPGPLHADLVEARPRDVTLELAVSTREGEADFWVSSPDSGFSGFERLPDELVPEGFSFARKRIRCARLDALIDEHASDRAIDFLKVDVEGAERDVLSSFDPETIRPTVILVESISPLENRQNHEEWESLLVDRGYLFAAFDGINRFYVPVEHAELIEALAYPISVLDRYESADVVSERSRASLQLERQNELEQNISALRAERSRMEQELQKSASENRTLAVSRDQATAELRAIQTTVSWRLTRPLRAVRTAQLRRRRPVLPATVERHASSAAGVVRNLPGASEVGPVFEVTGVASTEILRRCATRRAGGSTSTSGAPLGTWSLADFASASDVEFVRAAHVVLLGRLPGEAAATRRAAELDAGRPRLEILMRLALSPEGRRYRHTRVSGVMLRTLVATGRGLELVARTPVFGAVVQRVEQFVRHDASGEH